MSTITAPQYTYLDHIPLGRRIREVMVEKGNYYSISAMAKRIGINRETYRLMLNGHRDIYFFELAKIAEDLKVSVERLLQKDIEVEAKILIELLSLQSEPQKALALSSELIEESIGLTEVCMALYRQGVAYFFSHQYDSAFLSLSKAHKMAMHVVEEYSDQEVLYRVLSALMDVFTANKDYVSATKLLDQVESYFRSDSTRAAAIHYLHAKIKENMGDLDGARKQAYESMSHAFLTSKKVLIGKTEVNAAHYEYLLKNYEQSRVLLENAKSNLAEDVQGQYIARKELVKTLIKLSHHLEAGREINEALNMIPPGHNMPSLIGKLRLLRSVAENTSTDAECIVNGEEYGAETRGLAARFLTKYFYCKGDSEKAMHYYGVAVQLNAYTDILDEGAM